MKTGMAALKPQDSSSSKRHFHWTKKVGSEDDHEHEPLPTPTVLSKSSSSSRPESQQEQQTRARTKLVPQVAVAKLRSAVLTAFGRNRSLGLGTGLGPRVVGTLFGSRRGHVHFALQKEARLAPAFLIELATPISGLVKEMASGLVRIALECDKPRGKEQRTRRLLEESLWRTYCNGKKCGFATRRDCGPRDWNILKAVEPISMGAGVLPSQPDQDQAGDDQIMYMRAKFERVVGSRDSEAFYMMNPDSNGAPELSIYLLRV